jgi:hypothetical protein
LCETSFSGLTYLKYKYMGELNVENDLRLTLTNLMLRIDSICESKQTHTSH